MNKKPKAVKVLLILLILSAYPLYLFHTQIWNVIDKIGALATALALFAAMYQSYVAWKAANLTRESNEQNFFQQKFNLILEQHNEALSRVAPAVKENINKFKEMDTKNLVDKVREHPDFSPYMRILYHTLKTIRDDLPQFRDRNGKATPQDKKRYSSLVRSFISNDLLFLVACNSAVINRKSFYLPDSEQYSNFHKMLVDFSFFEHLNMQEKAGLNLKEEIKKITLKTYDSCMSFYFLETHYHFHFSARDAHLASLKALFEDPYFFICLTYNLQNKYLPIPSYVQNKLPLAFLSLLYFKSSMMELNESALEEYISENINAKLSKTIRQTVSESNVIVFKVFSDFRCELYDSPRITNYITEVLKFDNSIDNLIKFRDNHHRKLKSTMRKASSYNAKEEEYDAAFKSSFNSISENITKLTDMLIEVKQNIQYKNSLSEILHTKAKMLEVEFIRKFK